MHINAAASYLPFGERGTGRVRPRRLGSFAGMRLPGSSLGGSLYGLSELGVGRGRKEEGEHADMDGSS